MKWLIFLSQNSRFWLSFWFLCLFVSWYGCVIIYVIVCILHIKYEEISIKKLFNMMCLIIDNKLLPPIKILFFNKLTLFLSNPVHIPCSIPWDINPWKYSLNIPSPWILVYHRPNAPFHLRKEANLNVNEK